MKNKSHRFCVAPMMDYSDRHCRYFLRLLSRHARLYTEMVTTGAILHGDREYLLGFNTQEHPVALQLGGSVPADLAQAARIGADYGYDEINLNVGCPSDRVQTGRFGACLMAEPQLVAEGVAAMRAAATLPVTVKTRIGIDERDSYAELCHFVSTVASAGCDIFIIHARKAWLQGLSPKQNREIPPLRYDVAYQLKRDFPHLSIIINGGIVSLEGAMQHLPQVDGVMLGRAAIHDSYVVAQADHLLFGDAHPVPSRAELALSYIPYIEQQLALGIRLPTLTRHLLSLYHGMPGARSWRRYLSENAHRPGAGSEVVRAAVALSGSYSA